MHRYNALLDIETYRLLAIGTSPTITFLTDAIPNTFAAISVNWPNYLEDFFILSLKPGEYPEWQWSNGERKFRKMESDSSLEEYRGRALLASEKGRAFYHVVRHTNLSLEVIETGASHQDIIYFEKKTEAQRLKENGYIMKDPLEYPFVSGYASTEGITIREATERILRKARESSDILVKTENLRVHYFNKIKKATTREGVYVIIAEFQKESYYEGLVS